MTEPGNDTPHDLSMVTPLTSGVGSPCKTWDMTQYRIANASPMIWCRTKRTGICIDVVILPQMHDALEHMDACMCPTVTGFLLLWQAVRFRLVDSIHIVLVWLRAEALQLQLQACMGRLRVLHMSD
jgi:hypothetical protein